MKRYRHLPLEIIAEEWTGENLEEIVDFFGDIKKIGNFLEIRSPNELSSFVPIGDYIAIKEGKVIHLSKENMQKRYKLTSYYEIGDWVKIKTIEEVGQVNLPNEIKEYLGTTQQISGMELGTYYCKNCRYWGKTGESFVEFEDDIILGITIPPDNN